MVNAIKTFVNEEFGTVRTVLIDGEPWFVGKDVATALGYERADNAIRKHIDDEDKLMHQIGASGQNRGMYIINESGMYSASSDYIKACGDVSRHRIYARMGG